MTSSFSRSLTSGFLVLEELEKTYCIYASGLPTSKPELIQSSRKSSQITMVEVDAANENILKRL